MFAFFLFVLVSGRAPSSLVVTVHGLYGGAANLAVLEDLVRQPGVMVHACATNEGRTRDGVQNGGARLAEEVRDIVRRNPSLTRLSLVGNSLGGLYVRHAAALLLDAGGAGTMAGGLVPDALLTIGTPHCGVRRFLFWPVPTPLHALGGLFAGLTAVELLLRDGGGEPLLLEMARPGGRHDTALRAFRRRRLYANLRGDAMVPFGTAAIEGDGAWGAGCRDEALADAFARLRAPVRFMDERVASGEADGVAVIAETLRLDADAAAAAVQTALRQRTAFEAAMTTGLNSAGWSKVAVAFRSAGTWTPVAHNRLSSLRREGWRRVFERVEQTALGEPIMAHAAEYLADDMAT